jgi:hypothetical protein
MEGAGNDAERPVVVQAAAEVKTGLFDSAVLLSLELRVFGTSRKLANAEYEVDADKTKTGASKRLLKSDELKAISKHDAETRRIVALYTLPSQFRSGLYVLPLASIEKMDSLLTERKQERVDLVNAFCGAYDKLKYIDSQDASAGGLGAVYKDSDYPGVDQVREAFSMAFSYTEVQAPGRLRGISMAIYEREKEKAADCWRSAIEEGQAMLRGAFASLIEHMADRLQPGADGKLKVFRDSLVSNVSDFLNTFDSRNLANDTELAGLVKKASDMLKGVAPADLRSNETIKAKVQASLDSIKAGLDSLTIGDKPARKIDFSDLEGL